MFRCQGLVILQVFVLFHIFLTAGRSRLTTESGYIGQNPVVWAALPLEGVVLFYSGL